jgi:hypothetical protein
MTFLELCSALGEMPSTITKQVTLTNGAHVRYTVDHDIGGGSLRVGLISVAGSSS